jgi:hypothetical protein
MRGRKADGGPAGGPGRYTVQRPDEPDQNRCEERAQFSSTAPGRNPHPSPHSFDRLGPPFCGRVQSLCDGLGAEALQISAPSISAPSIKDDATHGEESGGEGNARAAQSVQSTTADEPDQNRCEERAQFSSTAPGRNPHPSPHSFDRLGHICTYIAGSLLLAYEVSAHTHIHPSTWHTSSQCWPRSW